MVKKIHHFEFLKNSNDDKYDRIIMFRITGDGTVYVVHKINISDGIKSISFDCEKTELNNYAFRRYFWSIDDVIKDIKKKSSGVSDDFNGSDAIDAVITQIQYNTSFLECSESSDPIWFLCHSAPGTYCFALIKDTERK